jgi:hypothetical protein
MKSLFLAYLLTASVPALADSYTGVVSDVKHFHNGGVAVDLDGHWPKQKMTF